MSVTISFILIWLWQLPQHLLAVALIKALKAEKTHYGSLWYWEFKRASRFSRLVSGVSLGSYILLPQGNDCDSVVLHEHGHSIQSRMWGPLYLLAVGIPSAVFNNLWDRLFHKKWSAAQRTHWYYSRYPEKQADMLGGVERPWRA